MKTNRYSSGTEWEPIVGYSRAIRRGSVIHVSGTTATDVDGNIVGEGDPAAQTEQIIVNVQSALKYFGASLNDVVRTRIFVCNIKDWEVIGKVHGKYFCETLPATSMIEVSRLIDPRMLLEIEAEAIVED
jgi:enamine deaminase RidA (YjgF/YER057c/UK114 family)